MLDSWIEYMYVRNNIKSSIVFIQEEMQSHNKA